MILQQIGCHYIHLPKVIALSYYSNLDPPSGLRKVTHLICKFKQNVKQFKPNVIYIEVATDLHKG